MQAGRIRLVGHRVNSNPHGSTESCAEGRRQLVEFVDLARVAWYGGSHPTWIRYREGREYRYHSGQNRWFFYDEKYFYDKEYLGSISAITTAWEWMMESNDTIRVRVSGPSTTPVFAATGNAVTASVVFFGENYTCGHQEAGQGRYYIHHCSDGTLKKLHIEPYSGRLLRHLEVHDSDSNPAFPCQHGDELWRLSLGFSNNERLNPQLAFEFLNQLIKMQRGTPLEHVTETSRTGGRDLKWWAYIASPQRRYFRKISS